MWQLCFCCLSHIGYWAMLKPGDTRRQPHALGEGLKQGLLRVTLYSQSRTVAPQKHIQAPTPQNCTKWWNKYSWLPRPNKLVSHKIQNRSILQTLQPGAATKTMCFQKMLDFRLVVWVSFFTCSPFSTPKCLAMPSELFHSATATSLTPTGIKTKIAYHSTNVLLAFTSSSACDIIFTLFSFACPSYLQFQAPDEHWMPWFLLSFDVALQYLPSLSWCMRGKKKDE